MSVSVGPPELVSAGTGASAVAPGARPAHGGVLPALKRGGAVAVAAVLFGAAAGALDAGGDTGGLIALILVLLPLALWKRPQLGPIVLFMSALLVEQFPINLQNGNAIGQQVPITNRIPLFQGLGSGLHVEPADILILVVFAVYLLRSSGGARWWPRSHVSVAVAGMVGVVVLGEVLGLMHHGDIRESFEEIRPFFYFAATYLATSVMIRTRSALRLMLWGLVAAETIKSIQAIYIYAATRSFVPRPQNVLGHEEAMFFSLFFFVVAALWLYEVRGRLRTVATTLVPLVLFADLVNDRRTAWLILGAGMIVMLALTYRAVPHRRRTILKIAGVVALCSAVYFPAFWNSSGALGMPADAVRSQLGTPSTRDALSDEYRVQEDANLEYNIQHAGPVGEGFGVKIDYALPMPNLVVGIDPEILYVPHNGVLYVLMRMGVLGGIALFGLLGAAIIAGCRLARCLERELAAIGAVSAAVVVGWAFEGATDMGFTLYRVAFVVGCVVGLAEAARHLYLTGPLGPSGSGARVPATSPEATAPAASAPARELVTV